MFVTYVLVSPQSPPKAAGPARRLGHVDGVAQPNSALLANKGAFIADVLRQMTLDEKIGQLRLISIGREMPSPQLAEEIAAGRVGGTFNSVIRPDNRPLQDAAIATQPAEDPDVLRLRRGPRPPHHLPDRPRAWRRAGTWTRSRLTRAHRRQRGQRRRRRHDLRADGRHRPRPALGPHLRRLRRRPVPGVARCARAQRSRASRATRPTHADSIMAPVKHFALYGAVEGGRDYNTVDMSPMRMYQDYLPPYRAAIDAGAGGVMVALNSINGVPATSNTWLHAGPAAQGLGLQGRDRQRPRRHRRADAPRRGARTSAKPPSSRSRPAST